MSAGNLHPIELYVVQNGVWHYDPLVHRLDLIRPADESVSSEGATVVVTGIPARTCWKYAARGFRHLFWDAGTMLANLLAAAAAYGVSCSVSVGFDDAEVGALLGIEAPDEVPLAVVALGGPAPRLDDRGLGPVAKARPITRTPIRFEGVTAALRATCLATAEVAPWRERLLTMGMRSATATVPPPPFDDASIEEVILRRGSTRHFRPTTVPRSLFDWALGTAMQPPALDVAGSGIHIGQLVHVHDVEEVVSGIWSDSTELQLVARQDAQRLRELSMRYCLDQELGGDSGLTVFLTADLGRLFDQAGGRVSRRGDRSRHRRWSTRPLRNCARGRGDGGSPSSTTWSPPKLAVRPPASWPARSALRWHPQHHTARPEHRAGCSSDEVTAPSVWTARSSVAAAFASALRGDPRSSK